MQRLLAFLPDFDPHLTEQQRAAPPRYYEQVLSLFALGWYEGRYRFAADGDARLQWFYERTPFYDDRYRLYPVGREG